MSVDDTGNEVLRKAAVEVTPGDNSEYKLRVDAEITVPPVTIDTTGLATDSKQDVGNASLSSIDSKITIVDTGNVTVSSSTLPTGASTEAKQDTGNTSLNSIDSKITAVDTDNVTIVSMPAVSIDTTGLATEAKQDVGNASLSSIDTKLTSQATAAKQDTGNVSLASIDTKLSSQATSSKQDTGNTSLASIDTKLSSQATASKQDTGNASVASIDTKISDTNTKLDTLHTDLSTGPVPVSLPNYSADGSFSDVGEVVISCKGMGSVWVHIQGDWVSGGFTFQGSIKSSPSDPSDWFDVQGINLYNLDGNPHFSFDESISGTYTDFQVMVAGLKWFKFECTSISGGSADYQIGAAESAALVSGILSIIYAGQAGSPWSVTTV